MDGCFTKCPDCCSHSASEATCCCIRSFSGSKFCCGVDDASPDTCCLSVKSGCYIVPITTCAKLRAQICCRDVRCAIPCDDKEVPCALSLLPCCVAFVNYQCQVMCCPSVGDILVAAAPPILTATATDRNYTSVVKTEPNGL
jgi:hypothetical protein